MSISDPQPETPGSPAGEGHRGPLHLQRFLAPGSGPLVTAIHSSVQRRVDAVLGLQCRCSTTVEVLPKEACGLHPPPPHSTNPHLEKRTSLIRRQNIESGSVPAAGAQTPSLADGTQSGGKTGEGLKPCCFFALQLNDEEGVIHAYCRRCNRKIIVYDRALYWGVKRRNGQTPPTYPYQCSCGGHTLEIALGLEYPPEVFDENDLETITVAVRCAGCGEVAIIFSDEAT